MSPLIVFILLTHLTYKVEVWGALLEPIIQKVDEEKEVPAQEGIIVNIKNKNFEEKNPNEPVVINDNNKSPTGQVSPKNATVSANTTVSDHKKFKAAEVMESGALVRGVVVVVALSVLVIIYMAVKTYYGKRNRTAMVRKYGVRTRRSDIEMTPLPLEEDEEDETLFEVGNVNR